MSDASGLVPAPHQFHCAAKALIPTCLKDESPCGSSCPLAAGEIISWRSGGCTPVTREVITYRLHNPGQAPKKCCGNLKLRYGSLRQFSRKQRFIVPAQTQQTHVQRLSPENKGVSPCIPLQAAYRSKKQSSTHLWLHVTSLAILFSQCYVMFMFQFFKFYLLLCHPFSCFIKVQPVCFFSGPPLTTPAPTILCFYRAIKATLCLDST
jgi:hypothetical protein